MQQSVAQSQIKVAKWTNLISIAAIQFLLLSIIFYGEKRYSKLQAYIENYLNDKQITSYTYFRSIFDILVILTIPLIKVKKNNISKIFEILILFNFLISFICEIFYVNYPLIDLWLNLTIKSSIHSVCWYLLTTDISEIFLSKLSKFDYVLFGFACTILTQVADMLSMYIFELLPYDVLFRSITYCVLAFLLRYLNRQEENIDDLKKENLTLSNLLDLNIHKKIITFKIPLVSLAVFGPFTLLLIFGTYRFFSSAHYRILEKPKDSIMPVVDYVTFTPAFLRNYKIPTIEKINSLKFKSRTILLQLLLFGLLILTKENEYLQKTLKLWIYSFAPLLFAINQIIYYKDQSKLKHGAYLVYSVFRRTCREIPYLCFTYETKLYIKYVSEIVYESTANILSITLNNLLLKNLLTKYGLNSSEFIIYSNIFVFILLLCFAFINTLQIYLINKNYQKKIEIFENGSNRKTE